MAGEYVQFLHQIPWYKYDFPNDLAKLDNLKNATSLRDVERRFALGVEFGGKSAYAKLIAQAVAATGVADLEIRSVVQGVNLQEIPGVSIIEQSANGTTIETPRYAEFTEILKSIALKGGEIIEIAGNDEIMLTALSATPQPPKFLAQYTILTQLPRQGYNDTRWLITLPIPKPAQFIRQTQGSKVTLEHIFDY